MIRLNQTGGRGARGVGARVLALGALVVLAFSARAQLAITEVMSDAATNHGPVVVPSHSDFWELTNYGPTPINLAGYFFADSLETPLVPLVAAGDPPLLLAPNQSVVLVRSKETTNVAQFRAWWGACLALNVPVRLYPRTPGFDNGSDGLRLWDAASNLIDRVNFGVARKGVTFVSDPSTGAFGVFSQFGPDGTCQAATADDLGSPGTAGPPVPLQILQQPASQLVCAGTEATFTVQAIGLPRPRFQWFRDNVAIPGATAARHTVTNALPAQAGAYRVAVFNGVMLLNSTAAPLIVSTTPSPPSILAPPLDFECYAGQTARFAVTACAFPLAAYQWLSNGVPLGGATNRALVLPNCTSAMSGAQFCVGVQNAFGSYLACARLTVTPKPELRITEIMAHADPDCPQHGDWFELTNQGTNALQLLGWRFADRFSLEGARAITQSVTLLPGQSALLVESLTAEAFRQWWGVENLPPGLPILTYTGLGFSELGDEIYLWNAAATDPFDVVDSKSFAATVQPFSLRFDELDCYFGCASVVAEFGALRAAQCSEVGSPGYTTNPPPRLVSVRHDSLGTHLTWRAVEGKTYRLEANTTWQSSGWSSLGDMVATNSLPGRTDASAARPDRRFYRVLQLTP